MLKLFSSSFILAPDSIQYTHFHYQTQEEKSPRNTALEPMTAALRKGHKGIAAVS